MDLGIAGKWALVGGASLKAEEFMRIVRSVKGNL